MITPALVFGLAVALILVPAAAAIVAAVFLVVQERRDRAADRAHRAMLTRPDLMEDPHGR